jgi:hypothetical protein
MSRELLKQALDVIIELYNDRGDVCDQNKNLFVLADQTIAALEAELAKPEQEPQVCCGDYEKCWKACTPRGRWLAEKELAKPEQAKYSDIVSDGGLDPRNKFDAQPEQEPVAWHHPDCAGVCLACLIELKVHEEYGQQGLNYLRKRVQTPRKEWVGLTDELKDDTEIMFYCGAKWAETKLKELNT